ncbi:uncharacterized protein LOC106468787 [Limulus polyphemus]|uniref:Uncharacterized protein LOC106468787 n=1 Tax=Limulus polyphemus TaxID=6850 RepID=A0ABM1BM00_LIMPO|nr:uncharacterized protein LOC106468787 [Limulus polyphemus]
MTTSQFLIATLVMISTIEGQERRRNDSNVENVVRSAVADEFSSEIVTNKTRAYLSCESGEMVVTMNFTEPYRGITYTDYDRSGPCKLYGDGRRYYQFRIPLKGCGTKQEAPRVFINNILVRFHRSLELDDDEVKTIICRYPPPLAPPPNNLIPTKLEPTPPLAVVATPKLSEIELLLIVCALLFLTLLLLGVGMAYYCLKKRNIKIVRRRRTESSVPGSEITKLSSSTRGPTTMIGTISIPRASAISGSGSEAVLLTSGSSQHGSGGTNETLPSDYPSESPSSINSDEELDAHKSMSVKDFSNMRNGGYRFQNRAFVPDEGPIIQGYPSDQENIQTSSSFYAEIAEKPFEYRTDDKRQRMVKQMLTTIIEKEDNVNTDTMNEQLTRLQKFSKEDLYSTPKSKTNASLQVDKHTRDSFFVPNDSASSLARGDHDYMQSEIVEFLPVEKRLPPDPSYEPSVYGSISDNGNWSQTEIEDELPVRPYIRKPKFRVSNLEDRFFDTRTSTEIEETKNVHRWTHLSGNQTKSVDDDNPEDDLMPQPKPHVTLQNIDEVHFSKMNETSSSEYSKIYKKEIKNQYSRKPTSWDVKFRNHPPELNTDKNWDEEDEKLRDTESNVTKPAFQRKIGSQESTCPEENVRDNFFIKDIVFRVLNPSPITEAMELSEEDKEKWKTIINSDTTFRSLIQEATATEELIRISRDERYKQLYTPNKWQVIIRILSAPDYSSRTNVKENSREVKNPRFRKKSDYETRNRKSSLTPLYEIDSENSRSGRSSPVSVNSHWTSRSFGSARNFDGRSMTEMDVDFTHADKESLWSVDTGYTHRTARSAAERSCSEYIEEVPTISSLFGSGHCPVLERSTSEFLQLPETILKIKDCDSRTDYHSASSASIDTLNTHRKTSLDCRRSHRDLDNYPTEITITSPVLRTLDRASSVGEREEIKSTSETDIYDWQR